MTFFTRIDGDRLSVAERPEPLAGLEVSPENQAALAKIQRDEAPVVESDERAQQGAKKKNRSLCRVS